MKIRTAKEDEESAEVKSDIEFMTMYMIKASAISEQKSAIYFVRGSKGDAINYFMELLGDGGAFSEKFEAKYGGDRRAALDYAKKKLYVEAWGLYGSPKSYDGSPYLQDDDYLYSIENADVSNSKGIGDWLEAGNLREWVTSLDVYLGDSNVSYVIGFDWLSETAYNVVQSYYFKHPSWELGEELYKNYDKIAKEVRGFRPFTDPAYELNGWDIRR